MTFKSKTIATLILGTAFYTTSSLAAYGPAPAPTSASAWDISVGYGQTFGHKETTWGRFDSEGVPHEAGTMNLDDLKIFEADIFHKSNFGVVFMGTAEDGVLTIKDSSVSVDDAYTFQALMAGYRFSFADNLTARIAGGTSKQESKFEGDVLKKDGFAANANIRYGLPLSKGFMAFVEAGYLMQDKLTQDDRIDAETDYFLTLDPNAGYWKVGVSFGM